MPQLITGFTSIWTITLAGYLLGRYPLLGPGGPEVLARFVFFIAAPALLFVTLAGSSLADLFSPVLATFVASTLIVAGGYLLLARYLWRRPIGRATIGALCASYVNAANLGLPVAAYVLGDISAIAPVLLFQVLIASVLALAVLDTTVDGRRPDLRRLIGLPARTPIMLGCAAGLGVALAGWPLPTLLTRPFELVGSTAVPLALLALGMSLRGSRPFGGGPQAGERFTVVVLKVLAQPGVSYLIARYALGLAGPELLAAVVISGLPTAQNVFVYATRYRQAEPLARDAVVLSTLVAAGSLTAVAVWLH